MRSGETCCYQHDHDLLISSGSRVHKQKERAEGRNKEFTAVTQVIEKLSLVLHFAWWSSRGSRERRKRREQAFKDRPAVSCLRVCAISLRSSHCPLFPEVVDRCQSRHDPSSPAPLISSGAFLLVVCCCPSAGALRYYLLGLLSRWRSSAGRLPGGNGAQGRMEGLRGETSGKKGRTGWMDE